MTQSHSDTTGVYVMGKRKSKIHGIQDVLIVLCMNELSALVIFYCFILSGHMYSIPSPWCVITDIWSTVFTMLTYKDCSYYIYLSFISVMMCTLCGSLSFNFPSVLVLLVVVMAITISLYFYAILSGFSAKWLWKPKMIIYDMPVDKNE